MGYPSMSEELQFGQEIEFSHDGRPFLEYRSRTWNLDSEGNKLSPLATETGYWRVAQCDDVDMKAKESAGIDIEVLLVHPTGYAELYLGWANSGRIELSTDAVIRTSTAKTYNAAQRMYGLVEGELMWVMDMAAVGVESTSHASARLRRISH